MTAQKSTHPGAASDGCAMRLTLLVSLAMFVSVLPLLPASAAYATQLQSPTPPSGSKVFAWRVGGARSAPGREISHIELAGCWTANQVAGAVATDAQGAPLALEVHSGGTKVNRIEVKGLNDQSLPVLISVTFTAVFGSVATGATVFLKTGGGATSGETFGVGGPTCGPAYTLTLTPATGGSTAASPTGPTYTAGATVAVTATPDAGYAFSRWTVDGQDGGSTNPLSVTMDADHAIAAAFTPSPTVTLLLSSGDGGSAAASPPGPTYPPETTITVTATPAEGYTFDSWTLDGAAAGATNPLSVVMDANHTLLATFRLAVALPPDPGTVAPLLDRSVATDLATASRFLYTGSNPIQTGVEAGTIEPRRIAVLRGRVVGRDGNPVPAVTVTAVGHPEFGQTLSRADGGFDLAVNGGGPLVIRYAKAGLITVQRQVEAPWHDYAFLPEVVMVPFDQEVSAIALGETTDVQVARGTPVTDGEGTRQATLLFPQGTKASLTLPDGATEALSTLHVRATEYTVGDRGPEAMPAELPPTSAYTYALELSADEAVARGATRVNLSQAIPLYVENFLGFAPGTTVPAGYYDRAQGRWVASDNGVVLKIVAEAEGTAALDADGDGAPDSGEALAARGITAAEQQRLADLYEPGQSLWRVPIRHFTPWDLNWPYGLPDDATPPDVPDPTGDDRVDNQHTLCGSIIGCENQTLGESLPVTGTPFTLHYSSDRVPGRSAARTLDIPLSGTHVPDSLTRIELQIRVAGQRFAQSFPPAPNQSYRFRWNGMDAYGRLLQGAQEVTVRVGYTYGAVYRQPSQLGPAFTALGGLLTGVRARNELTLWRHWTGLVTYWDAREEGRLGGWSLNVHHTYDPGGRVLYLGDGTQRSATNLARVVTTVAGSPATAGTGGGDGGPATKAGLQYPAGLAVAPDGTLYISDQQLHRVRKVAPNGIITTVAGGGSLQVGDGGPATQVELRVPSGLAVAADGSVYIADQYHFRIRKVSPDGIITTFAGTGVSGFSGDGGPATEAQISHVMELAMGPDGSVYLGDFENNRVRRVGPDGIITTVAGTGAMGFSGDGDLATKAQFRNVRAVAVDPQGNLYVGDYYNQRVRRVGTDGIITTVAGNGISGFAGDGGPATQARLYYAASLAFSFDGTLFINDYYNRRIRKVTPDGIIVTVLGNGSYGSSPDGTPATDTLIGRPGIPGIGGGVIEGLALAPDASALYYSDSVASLVRQVSSPLGTGWGGDIAIASTDGTELYRFSDTGRHLTTVDTLTGALVYRFSYDTQGRLSAITDGYDNTTAVERDASGNPTEIVSPGGQRTVLTVRADGYLASMTDPATAATALTYAPGGLLATLTDPRGNAHWFGYDADGRLTSDHDPAGGSTTLARTDTPLGHKVQTTSALGRTRTYEVEELPTGQRRRVITDPSGGRTETLIGTGGSRRTTYPDGTVATAQDGPDPRFGMQAPFLTAATATRPGGTPSTFAANRVVTLNDPANPLSLVTLTTVASTNGRADTSVFTAGTRTLKETSAAGRQRITALDAHGRISSVQAAGAGTLNVSYDTGGRPVTLAHTDGTTTRTTTLAYSTDGFLASVTDPLNHLTRFQYDHAGRVTSQTRPDGSVVAATYDAAGNTIGVTPPGAASHALAYTSLDQLSEYRPPALSPAGETTSYTYTVDRQHARTTRPDGQALDLAYDQAGRLASLTTPRGPTSYTYTAPTGTLAAITAPGGISLTYAHDGSLVTSETATGPASGTVGRSYDSDLRTTTLTAAGTITPFSYDPDGLLTAAGALSLTRDPDSGLVTASTAGQVTDAFTYDGFGATASYSAAYAGNALLTRSDTRDALGRVVTRTETIAGTTRTTAYSYDDVGRLTRVTEDGQTATYSYDANGNRLSATTSAAPGGTVTATYDAQDRLLRYGTTTFTHTAAGELATRTDGAEVTTYDYDPLGNLRTVTQPDGTTITYLIDGRNRRVGKQVNGTLVQVFVYQDRLRSVAELDGAGNVVSRFIYATGAGAPAYMIRNGVTYRIIADELTSPRLIVDTTTGAIAQRIDYDAFGNMTADSNPGFQPFGFAGGLYDRDTRLVRFGARDYDPETGRWMTKDPLLFGGHQVNLYGYVRNDPINLLDPTGLDVQLCRTVADIGWWNKYFLKVEHWWIKTSTMEAGLGPAGGGVPGEGGSDYPLVETTINPHPGRSQLPGSICSPFENVDEECVNRELTRGGSRGRWTPSNQCQTVAMDILTSCRTGSPRPQNRWELMLDAMYVNYGG